QVERTGLSSGAWEETMMLKEGRSVRNGFWGSFTPECFNAGGKFRFTAQIPEVREAHRPEVNRGIEASENAHIFPPSLRKGPRIVTLARKSGIDHERFDASAGQCIHFGDIPKESSRSSV